MILSRETLELIDVLNKTYSNIIMVIDPLNVYPNGIYICTEFRENTQSVKYFSMSRYRNITHIITELSTSFNLKNRLEEIVTSIETTEIIVKERKFCDNFIWIKF